MNITLPPAFEYQMRALLEGEYENFVQGLNSLSPTCIRLNPLKAYSQQITDQVVPWWDNSYYLNQRPNFSKDPFWHSGAYYVQEAGSMFVGYLVEQLIEQIANPIVLDLCAAPGGKSTQLASVIGEKGLLISNEVVKTRLHILQENLIKWGLPNVVITNNDPSQFTSLEHFFDVVVVDAPCSGEGLFRKQPEAMAEWSEKAVEFCAARQKRILQDIWPSIKPGGFLVYSTCTYNKQENENNIQWLIEEFQTQPFPISINPSWNITVNETSGFQTYRFYPHKTYSEGFFVTVLQKQETDYSDKRLFTKKPYFSKLYKEELSKVQEWITVPAPFFRKQPNGTINILPEEFYDEIEYLASRLKVIYCGTEIAEIKGKDINPTQALANSVHINKGAFPLSEIDIEAALKFLAKQEISLEGPIGTQLIVYQHVPLGWIKKMANRNNNYYPQEWRLRSL